MYFFLCCWVFVSILLVHSPLSSRIPLFILINILQVLFSDESTFRIVSNAPGLVRRPPGSNRYDQRYVRSTVKHPQSQMVWGCFSGEGGRASLWFLPPGSTMNQTTYLECLESKMLPIARDRKIDYFLQDSAPCHKSKKVMKYLKNFQSEFKVIDWPGNSPDLNPIENCWGILKAELGKKTFANIAEMREALTREWFSLPLSYFQNLVKSMPNRLKAVIENDGGPTKY